MHDAAVKRSRAVRILRIVMPLAALVSLIIFPPWQGVLAWLTPLPDTVQEQVDAAVGRGLDGIIVCVDRAGREPELYAAGWKDRAAQIPADPQALFKIASISKLYVAVAAAKLVAAGQLSLDDTVAALLPELADRLADADRITLAMLLRHRSGIPNYTDQDGWDWGQPPADADARLEMILDLPADFAPDAEQRYSNTNYLLVGRILDRALDGDHREYIRREVLVPLGLVHTFGSLSDVDPDQVAGGYHHGYDQDFKAVAFDTAGASMVATAQDVGAFVRALNDGSLLSDAEQAVYASVYELGHKGWVLGYQSIARYHEDLDAVVVQFVNTTGGDSELVSLVVYDRIVKILRRSGDRS